MTESRDIAPALTVTAEFGSGRHEVQLRVPPVIEVLPALPDLQGIGTREQFLRLLRLELLALVDTVDGHEATFAEIDQILGTPAALRVVLEARNQAYVSLRQSGRFWCGCPRCGTEVAFDIGTYAVLGLGLSELPPMVTPTLLAVPKLSSLPSPGRRPDGTPRSTPIRFELPCAKAGLDTPLTGGVLSDVEPGSDRIAAAWDRVAPEGTDHPSGPGYRHRGNPAFEAILHLSLALERLDGASAVTPDVLEELLVPDFYFLDATYYLTHAVDIEVGGGLVAPCPSCGQVYVRAR